MFISHARHGMQTTEGARWKGLSGNGVSEQIALSKFSFSGLVWGSHCQDRNVGWPL